jgi:DDE superfamily endonuclease
MPTTAFGRTRPWATGRLRLSPSRIWPSGYPWQAACNRLSIGSVQNAGQVSQIGVFLADASRHGHALIDRALDLPETWAADAARRAEAGVPEQISFTPKPKLGQAMLKRAFAAGVPCAFVVSDSL